MHLSTQEVLVQNLEIGMYVSRLDVPWVQTPFPIQGFQITKDEELELLSHYCNKVYIDTFLSKKIDVKSKLRLSGHKKSGKVSPLNPKVARMINEKARFKPRVNEYKVKRALKKEIKSASHMFEQITYQMSSIYQSMEQDGYINISEVRKASNKMVKSITQNPNALAWLCRINTHNQTLYQQAIRSAVWAIIFARHLGLSEQDLRDLGTALLLAPIGKSRLPQSILNHHETQDDILAYQEHIDLTLEETRKIFSSSHQVNYIISGYCERNDGSGFPRNLVGNRIPFLSRVAGIADYYEQLINPLSTDNALTPAEAISELYYVRGSLFQKELVESFIQAIGIYPTGSLVKLSNNSTAIVLEQPEKSKLKPKVAVIKNAMNVTLSKPKRLTLSKKPTDEYHVPLKISKSLPSTSVDLEASQVHENLFGKSWLTFLNA